MDLSTKLKIEWDKVLIVWNWSYKNMWDELILIWTIKLLQEQGKKIYISAYNPSWLKKFLWQFIDVSEIEFLREIPKWFRSFFRFIRDKKSRILKKYKEVDSIIIWWGEILTEEVPSNYWYWLISIFPCLKQKPNIYLMGWIQVPKKPFNRRLFDFLLKRVKYIYARDLDSVYGLEKYGFSNLSDSLQWVEFFMDTSYFAFDWEQYKHDKLKKWKYIVINLNKNGEKFLEDIIKDVKYYLSEGYKIYYVPVAKWSNNYYSDISYLSQIKKACKMNERFEVLDWEYNFEKFVDKLSKAEIVISTRLHLFLISSFLGVRTKIYPYQKKILKMQKIVRDMG